MPAFPTKFGGPVISGLDRSPCVPVSSQNKNNNSCSIPRILCGIATLGISELVRVLCNYHAAKNEAKPEVQQNIIRLYNYNVVESMLNPQQESIFLGVMYDARKKACHELEKSGFKSVKVEKYMVRSLKTLKMRLPQIKERLTYETMVIQLTQELKCNCLESIVISLIESKLSNINPITGSLESVNESLIAHIVNSRGRNTLYRLATLPSPQKRSEKRRLSDKVVELTDNLGNQLENMLNSSVALAEAKKQACSLILASGGYTEENVKKSSLYKDIITNLRMTLDADDHRTRRQNRDNHPRKSLEDYQKLLKADIRLLKLQLQGKNSSISNSSISSSDSSSSSSRDSSS